MFNQNKISLSTGLNLSFHYNRFLLFLESQALDRHHDFLNYQKYTNTCTSLCNFMVIDNRDERTIRGRLPSSCFTVFVLPSTNLIFNRLLQNIIKKI